MYYKGQWCTAGGKDPLFGHVDGFQIDPNQSFPTEKGGTRMLRMEIALFLVVAFVAYMYFTAEKEH